MPIYIIAGEQDLAMAQASRVLYEVLTAQGGKATLVIYPKTEHVGSASRTWSDSSYIEWLFGQKRQNPANEER